MIKRDQKYSIYSYLMENPKITKKIINNLISDKIYLLDYDLIDKECCDENKDMYLNLKKTADFEFFLKFDENADFFAVSEFEIISLSSEDIYYKNILYYNLDLICGELKKNKYYLTYYLGDNLDNDFLEICYNL